MRHFVFTAGYFECNIANIARAKKTLDAIVSVWDMNACVTGCYEGSRYEINTNDRNNFSIAFVDEDVHRLVESCMTFTREYTKLKCVEQFNNK